MSEEQARQLMYQMQALEAYAGEMAQREAALAGALREAAVAVESVRGIGDGGHPDALVPLGLGAMARASVPAGGRVVLSVGAGVAVERGAAEAAAYLESRLKEVEASLQDASARKHDALARLEQARQQADRMVAEMQGAKAGG